MHSEMAFGMKKMPTRGEGDGYPSRTGRVGTARRSALEKADQCGKGRSLGNVGVDGKMGNGKIGDGKNALVQRRSRKYEHITSTVSKFMLTGISEPRRFRSVSIVDDIPMPFRNNSRKFKHVTSTVSKFLKTGIREPRRIRSEPVTEEVRNPVINKNFRHVTSFVREYILTGIFPSRKFSSRPLKKEVFLPSRRKTTKFVPFRSKIGDSVPAQKRPELDNVGRGNPIDTVVPELPENAGKFCETERSDDIIANLIKQLRAVNKEQPTEVVTMLTDLCSKFPKYFDLINSKDPFDLVLALGLGYHYKFVADFGQD